LKHLKKVLHEPTKRHPCHLQRHGRPAVLADGRVWGVVGMLVGVFIAAQLAWPELNFGIPGSATGACGPLHTNAVIFAFGGCALFATSYWVVQRTSQVPLFAPSSPPSPSGAGRP
jgi:cbb3-type cytochrome oxidase subunit 1